MKTAIAVFATMMLATTARSQGCSDAGFCTAGALQHSSNGIVADSSNRSSLALSFTAGSGEQATAIFIPQVAYERAFERNWQLAVKFPYYFASGNLGTHSGIGDPIVTLAKSWPVQRGWKLYGTVGTRISFTKADKADASGHPLPLLYQQGLGTTDVILGLAAQYKRWLFVSAGYQQPVFQYNENSYLAQAYPAESDDYKSYFDSRRLRRIGDMLLRADGRITRGRWTLSGGPLAIYHLGQDRITLLSGEEVRVASSEGLTLNLAVKLEYTHKKSRWELSGGTPLIVRDVRPDGLTRAWVLTLSYQRFLE